MFELNQRTKELINNSNEHELIGYFHTVDSALERLDITGRKFLLKLKFTHALIYQPANTEIYYAIGWTNNEPFSAQPHLGFLNFWVAAEAIGKIREGIHIFQYSVNNKFNVRNYIITKEPEKMCLYGLHYVI